jgi:hypothetical protein
MWRVCLDVIFVFHFPEKSNTKEALLFVSSVNTSRWYISIL